ncbi:MAG: hypothetical protein WC747_04765 [Candidatus Babeliales bacterium]|jgi:hypothetical protein
MIKNTKSCLALPMLAFTLLCTLLATLPIYATQESEQSFEQAFEQSTDVVSSPTEIVSDIPQTSGQAMPEATAQKNALSKVMDSISSLLSTIKDYFNNRSTKSILNSHALGIRNASQAKALAHKMKDLSTKDKQKALNDLWAHVRIKKEQNEIKAIENDSSLSIEQKDDQIETVKDQFKAETEDIQNVMKLSLKPTEFLSASGDGSDSKIFEIVDMSKIDPTQPLTEQYDALEKSGDITMPEKALAQSVTEYYANKVNLNFDQPVTEQIITAIPDWDNFDGQLQINILSTLTAKIPKEFLSQETNAKLDKEQEERRKKDILHAQELREQLEKDKAALKAGHALPEESVAQAVIAEPVVKAEKKSNKKMTKERRKRQAKERGDAAQAVDLH